MSDRRASEHQPWQRAWPFAVLLVLCVVFQVWLLQARWVNGDEGAHLMDVRLALNGLVPEVDFGARQPLYVYAYVPFLQLFGDGYLAGRVMPLLATVLAGWVLYLIGRRLWDRTTGLCAAALYLCAPTIFMNSTVVKTEPLAILLTCLGIYGLVGYLTGGRLAPLFFSGVAFGLGYYVRESTLSGLLAAILLILWWGRGSVWNLVQRIGVLGLGCAAPCAAVLLSYARYLPPQQLLTNQSLFPLAAIAARVQRLLGWVTPEVAAAEGAAAVRGSIQTWAQTHEYLMDAFQFNAHFLVGLLVTAGWWIWLRARRDPLRQGPTREQLGLAVAWTWLGSFALLYSYHIADRGFSQFYFREFIPPLALLLAAVLVECSTRLGWRRHLVWLVPAWVMGCVGVSVLQHAVGGGPGGSLTLLLTGLLGWMVFRGVLGGQRLLWYLAGFGALGAGFVLIRFTDVAPGLREMPSWVVLVLGVGTALALARLIVGRLEIGRSVSYAVLAVVSSASLWVASYAAATVGPAYDCIWSPRTLREVVRLVREHTGPEDEVLSGAVIWEFEARRKPFLSVSHPLMFWDGVPAEWAERIRRRFADHPPRVVVVDWFTQQTYFHVPGLESLIARSYERVEDVEGSRWPVRVFVLRDPRRGAALAADVAQAGGGR